MLTKRSSLIEIRNELGDSSKQYAVLLIGLPLSGKDTFLKELNFKNWLTISRDSIVLEESNGLPYNEAYRVVDSKKIDKIFNKKLLLASVEKQSVFINITHLSKKRRAKTIRYFYASHKIIGILFPSFSIEQYRIRNMQRNNEQSKYISEKVYLDLQNVFEDITEEEGIEIFYYYSGNGG